MKLYKKIQCDKCKLYISITQFNRHHNKCDGIKYCKQCNKIVKKSFCSFKCNTIYQNHIYKKNKLPWNKNLTKETDERVKKYSHQAWNKYLTKETDERVKKSSDKMLGRCPKWHKYIYINYKNEIFLFKSSYEVAYAFYLDCNKVKWKYEEITYKLTNCTYTPDFFIYDNNDKLIEIIETKGWMKDCWKKKYEMYKMCYPNEYSITKLIMKNDLELINKSYDTKNIEIK